MLPLYMRVTTAIFFGMATVCSSNSPVILDVDELIPIDSTVPVSTVPGLDQPVDQEVQSNLTQTNDPDEQDNENDPDSTILTKRDPDPEPSPKSQSPSQSKPVPVSTKIWKCARYVPSYCYPIRNRKWKCLERRTRPMVCPKKPQTRGRLMEYRCKMRHITDYCPAGSTKCSESKPASCYKPQCKRSGFITTCKCQFRKQYCFRNYHKNPKKLHCKEKRPGNVQCTRKPKINGDMKTFTCRLKKVTRYVPAGETKFVSKKPNPCYKPQCQRKGHITTCRCQYEIKYCYPSNKSPSTICQTRKPKYMKCEEKPQIDGKVKKHHCIRKRKHCIRVKGKWQCKEFMLKCKNQNKK